MFDNLTIEAGFSTLGMTFDGEEPKAIKVNKKARYCECGTKLSMYNLESACYRHLSGIAF